MSNPIHLRHARRAGITLALVFALVAIPTAAQAAPVNLATVNPFVVLGGTTVTNTKASVLNGDLGVAPGTALTGFDVAVVNGATHANDGVAKTAQADLTTAYNVAAEQPVSGGNDLSNTDLGERTLTPGAYGFTSSAQLTGALTLDAKGDPNAQFVFEIAAELTTAPASSVVLVNGASPCNVFWQVGSSATLDTTTVFQGNLMALTSISLNNGASVIGRVLARNGQVSLINNVLTRPLCAAGSTSPPTAESPSGPGAGSPTAPGIIGPALPGAGSAVGPNRAVPVAKARARARDRRSARNGRAVVRPAPREACTSGFRATVSGHEIKRAVFSLDGKLIGSRTNSPFAMSVRAAPGAHQIRVRVTFTDATHAKTMTLPYRACAAAVLHPRHGPSQFTG
ncbi:MAG: ice-binding family protein [Solirubrobacterales bacterium]